MFLGVGRRRLAGIAATAWLVQMALAVVCAGGAQAPSQSGAARERADRLIKRIVGMMKSGDDMVQERAQKEIRQLSERDRSALLAVSSHEYWEREFAWYLLATAGDRRVLPHLRQAVSVPDEREGLRQDAIEYLGKLNDRASVDTFIRLVRARDPLVRPALGALGRIDDERARRTLLELLEDPKLLWLYKEDAMMAVGQQRDPSGVSAIIRIASQPYEDPVMTASMKSVAAEALAKIGTPESVEAAVRFVTEIEGRQRRFDTAVVVANELRGLEKRTKDRQFRERLGTLISQVAPGGFPK